MPPRRQQPKLVEPKKQEVKPDLVVSRYHVKAINHFYDGLVFGCKFEKGVWEGPLTDWQLTMFREWGYTVDVL
jgi:hypothetical protein